MTENLSIFNIGQNAKEINQELYGSKGDKVEFDIRVEEGKSTTFIIRVLPFIKDVMKSKVKKFFYAVPTGGDNFQYFDSATSLNVPHLGQWMFCPVSDIWNRLSKNPDVNVQKLAEQLRRQTSIIQYVQVVNCPAKPELNGKFMPMKLPIELDKTLRELSEPNEAQKALGKAGITAMDLYAGVNIECTITGHKPFANSAVMRKWSISADKQPSEILLPLGPNKAMTPISQLNQADVGAYFVENQPIDIVEVYSYKNPSFDAYLAAYHWLNSVCGYLPGMREIIDNNFDFVVKFLNEQAIQGGMNTSNQNIQTQQASYGGDPMQAAAQAAEAQNVAAPNAALPATEAPIAQAATEAPIAQAATEAPIAQAATEAAIAQAATEAPTAGVVIP